MTLNVSLIAPPPRMFSGRIVSITQVPSQFGTGMRVRVRIACTNGRKHDEYLPYSLAPRSRRSRFGEAVAQALAGTGLQVEQALFTFEQVVENGPNGEYAYYMPIGLEEPPVTEQDIRMWQALYAYAGMTAFENKQDIFQAVAAMAKQFISDLTEQDVDGLIQHVSQYDCYGYRFVALGLGDYIENEGQEYVRCAPPAESQ